MKPLFIVLICFSSFSLFGQDFNNVVSPNPSIVDTQKLPSTQSYVEIGLGIGYGQFRDFATSPLIYNGFPGMLNFAYKMDRPKKETYTGVQYSIGYYDVTVSSSITRSLVNKLDLYYQHLHIVSRISADKWNFKVGGQANITGNYRYNPSLQNNSVGVEMINTLFVSGKVTGDVSRLLVKDKKVWFFHFHKEPRHRKLSFQLNVGVLNNSFRNGYAYIDQSAVINDPKAFGGYEYTWFTGFRMSSVLDYTIFLHNQNAVQFSYVWDAYHTGGDANRLEFGTHFLKFALLFKTN